MDFEVEIMENKILQTDDVRKTNLVEEPISLVSEVDGAYSIANQIILTDNAAKKVKELVAEEDNLDLKLRAFVNGGGCSGFQYGFAFDEIANEDDFVIEKDGITLLVDSMSFQYLIGAEIDYVDSLEGAQFTIKNPNAKTTCGCGSSFSV